MIRSLVKLLIGIFALIGVVCVAVMLWLLITRYMETTESSSPCYEVELKRLMECPGSSMTALQVQTYLPLKRGEYVGIMDRVPRACDKSDKRLGPKELCVWAYNAIPTKLVRKGEEFHLYLTRNENDSFVFCAIEAQTMKGVKYLYAQESNDRSSEAH